MDVMIKKIPSGMMSPEGERYIGMLLESIDDKFQFIKEGFPTLEMSVERLDQRIARIEERFEVIKTDAAIIKEDLAFLKNEAKGIRKELKEAISRKELLILHDRIVTLERKTGLA